MPLLFGFSHIFPVSESGFVKYAPRSVYNVASTFVFGSLVSSRQQHFTIPNNDHLTPLRSEHHYPIAAMTVIWGLDLKEMQWGKFKSSYMFGNTDYHLRRTKFGIYQGAMILTVVSESLGTAALSGTSFPFHSPPNYLTIPRLRRPTEIRRQPLSRRHGSQQQLRWHRQLQHFRRHLRRHHFRRRLLL